MAPQPRAGSSIGRASLELLFSSGSRLAGMGCAGAASHLGAKPSPVAVYLLVRLCRWSGIFLAGAAMVTSRGLQHDVLLMGRPGDLLRRLLPSSDFPDPANRSAHLAAPHARLPGGLDGLGVSSVVSSDGLPLVFIGPHQPRLLVLNPDIGLGRGLCRELSGSGCQ